MLANKHFESVLSSVRNSCLNYSIQVSPFSATISLRKSIVKDRTGSYIVAPPTFEEKNCNLRNEKAALVAEISSLHSKHEELLSNYASTNETIIFLQNSIKDRDDMIQDLLASKKADRKVTEDLQAELFNNKAEFQEKMFCISEKHNNEVILWKEGLDQVINNHRMLETKYCDLSEICKTSTESPQIIEYVPLLKCHDHLRSTSVKDEVQDTRIDEDYTQDCCSGLDPAFCVDLEKEVVVEKAPLSFVSLYIASAEPTQSSFPCIVSLIPHVVRILDPGRLPLANQIIWRNLEARYQEERKTCKQS